MVHGNQPIKVAIKYCGCCNPQIDLSRIAHHLADMAEINADFSLVPYSEEKIDVVVILCGCPRACGDKEEVKTRARYHLLIAGENIDGKAVHEEHLTTALQQQLEGICNHQ